MEYSAVCYSWMYSCPSRENFKDEILFGSLKTLTNLTNPQYANYKMFIDLFVKLLKFIMILYILSM